ncbi:NAD-dependent protein deacetylase [Candidatus Hepatincola sp. Av]
MPKKITLKQLIELKKIKPLLEKHKEGKLIIFCGAGISKEKANVPLFEELLENILSNADIIDIHTRDKYLTKKKKLRKKPSNEISSIFETLCKEYDREAIDNFIVEKTQKGKNTEYHEAILKLSKYDNEYRIITTNFDDLFKKAATKLNILYNPSKKTNQEHIKTYNVECMPFFDDFKDKGGLIYLHNTINDEKIIYTRQDFIETYIAQSRNRELLLQLFKDYTVLFLGYSLGDLLINYILSASSKQQKHYLITKDNIKEKTDNIEIINDFTNYSSIYTLIELWSTIYTADSELKKQIITDLLNSEDTTLDFLFEYTLYPTKDINFQDINTLALLKWLKYYNDIVNTTDDKLHNLNKTQIQVLHYIFYILEETLVRSNEPTEINNAINFCIKNNIDFRGRTLQFLTIIPNLKISDEGKLRFFHYLMNNKLDRRYIDNVDKEYIDNALINLFTAISHKELLIKYLAFSQPDIQLSSSDQNTLYVEYTNMYIQAFYNIFINNVNAFLPYLKEINQYFITFIILNQGNSTLDLPDLNINVNDGSFYQDKLIAYWFLIMKELLQKESSNIEKYIKQYSELAEKHYTFYEFILYLGKELKEKIPFEVINKHAIQPLLTTTNNNNYIPYHLRYDKQSIQVYLTANFTLIPQEFKNSTFLKLNKYLKEVKNTLSGNDVAFYKKYNNSITNIEIKQKIEKELEWITKKLQAIFNGKEEIENYNNFQTEVLSPEINENEVTVLEKDKVYKAIKALNNHYDWFSSNNYKNIIYSIALDLDSYIKDLQKSFDNNNYNTKQIKIKILLYAIKYVQERKQINLSSSTVNIIFSIIDNYSNELEKDNELFNQILSIYPNKVFYETTIIDTSLQYLFKLFNIHKKPTEPSKNFVGRSLLINIEYLLIKNLTYFINLTINSKSDNYIENRFSNYIESINNIFFANSELSQIYRILAFYSYEKNSNNFYNGFNLYNSNFKIFNKLLPYMNVNEHGNNALSLLNLFSPLNITDENLIATHTIYILDAIKYINKENITDYSNNQIIFFFYIKNFLNSIKQKKDIKEYKEILQTISPQFVERLLYIIILKQFTKYFQSYDWKFIKTLITSMSNKVEYKKEFSIIKTILQIAELWNKEDEIYQWLKERKFLDENRLFIKDYTKMFYTNKDSKLEKIKKDILEKYFI